jgi:Pyridoxamine 5'-phosphate oxidase
VALLDWKRFSAAAPELARFGEKRMAEGVMYIGTIRKTGYPRVHPFTPFISSGRLFAFMKPTSPKGHDLRRDGRFTIHSLVKDMNGSDGEFSMTGKAVLVGDKESLALAAAGCPYTPTERYVCFEFFVEEALSNHYVDGAPQFVRWKETSKS